MCKLLNFVSCFVLSVCFLVVNCKNVHNSPSALARTSDGGCEKIHEFFELRNITVNAGSNEKGAICGGRCCSKDGENLLKNAGRHDLEFQLRLHARSLRAKLEHTALTTRDHVFDLTRDFENKTLYLFSQIYQKMAVFAKEPITILYKDIRDYINISNHETPQPAVNIESTIGTFFTKLFPLVYHRVINLQEKDFNPEYKNCLRQSIDSVEPFGDIPKLIYKSLSETLKTTRVLLEALWLGADVLNQTDTLLAQETDKPDSCHTALLRMSYCPKCLGLDVKVKPCSGYCLNVLRGCLTQRVSELDHPWNKYILALEKMVNVIKTHDSGSGVNVDSVIKSLDSKITEAIMYAMENGAELSKKVNRACGHANLTTIDLPDSEEELTKPKERRQQRPRPQRPARNGGSRSSPIDTEMQHFLSLVSGYKGFFLNLADTLCRDENFAEQMDGVECWNGERIGEYTKTVVASSTSFQRYNPEVVIPGIATGQPISDDRVSDLTHKLSHMTLTVMSSLPVENYMQADEAGTVEGSGSGRSGDRFSDDEEGGRESNTWSDQDYDGSGSGYSDPDDDKVGIQKTDAGSKTEEEKKTSGVASTFVKSTWPLVFAALSFIVSNVRPGRSILL